jgi:hypothetical protein
MLNAKLIGGAELSYVFAKDWELPDLLERKTW